MCVEDAHGSLSVLHRFHPDVEERMLFARAFLHQIRSLVVPQMVPKYEQIIRRAEAKLALQCPSKMRGNNLYLKEYIAQVKKRLPQGTKLSQQDMRMLVAKAMQSYSSLSAERKEKLNISVGAQKRKAWQEIEREQAHLQSELQLSRKRAAEEQRQRASPCLFRTCTLSDSSLTAIEEVLSSDAWPRAKVQEKMTANCSAPVADNDEIKRLNTFIVPSLSDKSAQAYSNWAVRIINNRNYFRECGIGVIQGNVVHYFYFLYAVQGTHHLALLPMAPALLNETDRDTGDSEAASSSVAFSTACYHHCYQINKTAVANVHDFANADAKDIWVLPVLRIVSEFKCASRADWVSLDHFLEHREQKERRSRGEGHASGGSHGTRVKDDNPLLEKFPLLAKLLPDDYSISESTTKASLHLEPLPSEESGTGSHTGTSSGSGSHTSASSGPPELPFEVDEEKVWAELEAKRLLLESEFNVEDGDFEIHVRGGKNTAERKGVATDCVIGRSTHEYAEAWLKQYSFQPSVSFAFHKFTDYKACILAAAWCHRMQYFYTLFQLSLDLRYEYTATDIANYQEQLEFVDLQIEHHGLDDHVCERVAQIKSCLPAKPKSKSGSASSSSAPG